MALVVKKQPAMQAATGDVGLIPKSGRSSGEGNGNPLQYSCLENPKDRRALWATVHGVTKSWIQLSDQHTTLSVFSYLLIALDKCILGFSLYTRHQLR